MESDSGYCIVTATCADSQSAEKIAHALLDEKLAACIQVMSITSFYTWQGKRNKEPEQMLVIKAKAALYPRIEECIRRNHPYEVPEIIQIPIAHGFAPYLNWIEEASK